MTFITCEMCRLPHRPQATLCDDCGHRLGKPVTPGHRTAHAEKHTTELALGVALIVVMLVGNLVMFGGGGYFILTAPFLWVGRSLYRLRVAQRMRPVSKMHG